MFEALGHYYQANQEYVNGAASMLAILTFLYSIIRAISNRRKRIYVHQKSYKQFEKEPPHGITLTFSSEKASGGVLVVDKFLIVNRTHHILTDQAFASAITIGNPKNAKIYFARVLDTIDGGSAEIVYSDGGIHLQNLRVGRNGGLAFEIGHTGGIETDILLEPVELGEPKRYHVSNALDSNSGMMILSAIGIGLIAYGLFILPDLESRFLDNMRDLAFGVFGLSVLFLVFAPDLEWRVSRYADRIFGVLPVEADYLRRHH